MKQENGNGAQAPSASRRQRMYAYGPESSWVRKGLEVYFTVLIEFFWSKERIMEVY